MFTSIFLANVRTLFMVLSAFLNMRVNSKNISFFDKIFWAQWVSPTGWTLIATNPDKISNDNLYSNFKGIAIGLIVMCFFGLSIGYFIFGNLSKELISIPIFFIPLYLIILMLNTKEKIYMVTIISSGVLLILLYPILDNWSILLSGVLSAIPGYISEKYFKS